MGTDSSQKNDLAQDRTDWAEDRTIMANERTYAGWMRTGLASVGIGLGFHALFGKLEPTWIPKAIGASFILIGIYIFFAAQRQARKVLKRLTDHTAQPQAGSAMRLISFAMAIAALSLAAAMWFIS